MAAVGVLAGFGLVAIGFVAAPAAFAADGPPMGGTCPPANIVINTASTLYQFDAVSGSQLSAVPLVAGSGAYGDISYDSTGTVLYGISYPNDSVLYTIDPATGAYSNATPLTGAVTTDTAEHPTGTTNRPSVWNGLSPIANGLLLGSNTTSQIYEVNPATGETTHFAAFPTGIVSAGDFLVLPSGQILAVGIDFVNPGTPAQSIFYLIDATTKVLTEIGTGPQTFGAAQSGGNIYLATASGAINYIPISALPTTASSAALPTQLLSSPGLSFYGATSIQDSGVCNLQPTTSYTVAKAASTAGPVQPSDVVTYTVTVRNTGDVAYTALSAGFVDDLSQVLDDAAYVSGSATASAGSVSVAGNTLSWLGPLAVAPAAGSTVTITYQVKVGASGAGDGSLVNEVAPTGAGGLCASADACTVTVSMRSLAATGASITPQLIAALGLLLFGIVMTGVAAMTRRRQNG